MELSVEHYEALKTASARFLDEKNYGFAETGALVATIFGDDRGLPAFKVWSQYWTDMDKIGEALDTRTEYTLPKLPLPPAGYDGPSGSDIEMVPVTHDELSNDTPTSDAANRQRERDQRKNNGNLHNKEKKTSGRGFDDLMASCFIEPLAPNKNQVLAPIYYYLGNCNETSLKRQTWNKFKDSVAPSAERVASGEVDAPELRGKKRKIEDHVGSVYYLGVHLILGIFSAPVRVKK
ncbi:hypothetical protein C8J57DRAFT_1237052 [Mycena rebaudengoi]|nr:hypothetical protein C8J57DRAFT_1237052 [Mycena rebaudengoi]